MTSQKSDCRIRNRRIALGYTQAQVAERAGISRTAVTAIEGNRFVPSVAAALAIATVLECSVEELFGDSDHEPIPENQAWESSVNPASYWRAEVNGIIQRYPASPYPMLAQLPDAGHDTRARSDNVVPTETLVLACCDPAAGIVARHFSQSTGMRLIVIPRSSRQALELLQQGLIHLAGIHFSTTDEPDRNVNAAREILGKGYQFIRMAKWSEGIVTAATSRFRTVRAIKQARLNWIGREPGSGARRCLDQILNNRIPDRIAHDHRGVVESVKIGWAQAGICVQLASAEAGLSFLPIQTEYYDVFFHSSLINDRRLQAFLSAVRSPRYRSLITDLPGYDASETGELSSIDD